MIIYFDQNGELIDALLDAAVFLAVETEMSEYPITKYKIDEIAENRQLIKDILETRYSYNNVGQKKYYLSEGNLYIRDDWIEQL